MSPNIPYLPARIEGLAAIAGNLAWSWSREARALFRAIDEPLWHLTGHNAIELLAGTDPARLAARAADPAFLRLYEVVQAEFARLATPEDTWFARTFPGLERRPIAYFCAEFGLHNSVPIYSGGLGVLAGDHCKEASDLGVPLVGVGLFYTRGYFDQRLRLDGWQEDSDERFEPATRPLERIPGPGGEPYLAVVRAFDRNVHVGAWRMNVGRVPIYLLDTNLEENDPADRELSSKLYAGGPDMRLRQEWILGVGGVRILRAVGVDSAFWHANEGHAAFLFIERLRELTSCGTPLPDAVRQVRATSLFTTHTPVPAGHDKFHRDLVAACAGPVWEEMGVSRDALFALGTHPREDHGLFHMTVAAIRLCGRVNAVSKPHGVETRRIWRDLWPGREPDDVPIGQVTNGVHLATWMGAPIMALLDAALPGWSARVGEPGFWDQVLSLDPEAVWTTHLSLKAYLMNVIREEARRGWRDKWREAAHVVGHGTLLDPHALTIGFARRFATYKRANLVFRDRERLRSLLVDPWRPVQIVFAGKAHPEDTPGKELLQSVYQFTRDPTFEGRVAFLEDYDMHLAHVLVQGVDLWLNLPRVSLEACGTSGMKAALNAVPQLSTLDGWWQEGFEGSNGWAIPPSAPGEDADAADADRLYALLEREVIPLFYERDPRGVPIGWVDKMKHALRVAGARFTARRMVGQYVTECYVPGIRGEDRGDDAPTG